MSIRVAISPEMISSSSAFALPDESIAREPPEIRGRSRSDVRMMVIDRQKSKIHHSCFSRLPEFLQSGDMLIFNSSRTIPSSLWGWIRDSQKLVEVRLAEHLSEGHWLALILSPEGKPLSRLGIKGSFVIDFGSELSCVAYSKDKSIPGLWKIDFHSFGSKFMELLYKIGQPIHYEYARCTLGLDFYQNVYARVPGSLEMPSAGRPFTWEMLLELKHRGVETGFVVLHSGLSSFASEESGLKSPVLEEEYSVSSSVAKAVNRAKREGRRVIAVGTTVVRALESSAKGSKGSVVPARGYTRLQITPKHRLAVVDGLVTGLHEPETSHLQLLQAFVSQRRIIEAYRDALSQGYLWHEFGDLNLIL